MSISETTRIGAFALAAAIHSIAVMTLAACGGNGGPLSRCEAIDAAGNRYTAESANVIDASDLALQQCQYRSSSPTTCQSTRCVNTW
jgi:hypothetical protein